MDMEAWVKLPLLEGFVNFRSMATTEEPLGQVYWWISAVPSYTALPRGEGPTTTELSSKSRL